MSLQNYVNLNDGNCGETLVKSLRSSGYAILKNHNVPINLLDQTIEQWKGFFNSNEKYNLARTDDVDEGYFPLNEETMKKDLKADFKELYQAHYGSKLPESIDTRSTVAIFDALVSLGEKITVLIDSNLPEKFKKDKDTNENLVKMSSDCGNHIIRIIHYPPILGNYLKQRAEAHSDICLFTFIFGKFLNGLELQDFQGEWFIPDCDESSIVIFTSEMLEIYTKSYFKAVIHRVFTDKNTCSTTRYSIPFGFHPFRQAKLSTNLTAGQYLSQRLVEMGYDGKLNQKDY